MLTPWEQVRETAPNVASGYDRGPSGGPYYYRVKATNAGGSLAYSASASGTTATVYRRR